MPIDYLPFDPLKYLNRLSLRRKILLSPQPPLVSQRRKLVVFLTAKAGCTFATNWFLFQVGLLQVALDHHPWVHNYRRDVFYKGEDYKNLDGIFDGKMVLIKFVRNPFSRTVSSFIHAIRHKYEDQEMADYLGRTVDAKNGYTFREFVEYLGTLNLQHCNIHHKIQLHKAELSGLLSIQYTIRLEEVPRNLDSLEQKLGFMRSNIEVLRTSRHDTFRNNLSKFVGNSKFRFEGKDQVFPPTESFYDKETLNDVAKLYCRDFEQYGYDKTRLTR